MRRLSCFRVRFFPKSLFLFVLATGLGFGGTETGFPDTSGAPAENPLNPRVHFIYQGEKSPGTAIAWSALGTLAPVVVGLSIAPLSDDATLPLILVLGGVTVGPSLGEFYAASPGRAFAGVGVRMAGELAFLYVAAKSAPSSSVHPLAMLSLVPCLASAAYSLYNANAAARRYNSALRARTEWGWSPILIPGKDGSMRTGALAYLRF